MSSSLDSVTEVTDRPRGVHPINAPHSTNRIGYSCGTLKAPGGHAAAAALPGGQELCRRMGDG